MEIVVEYINAEIAWPDHAEQGIHIRPITVNQTAAPMDQIDNFLNILFEKP